MTFSVQGTQLQLQMRGHQTRVLPHLLRSSTLPNLSHPHSFSLCSRLTGLAMNLASGSAKHFRFESWHFVATESIKLVLPVMCKVGILSQFSTGLNYIMYLKHLAHNRRSVSDSKTHTDFPSLDSPLLPRSFSVVSWKWFILAICSSPVYTPTQCNLAFPPLLRLLTKDLPMP